MSEKARVIVTRKLPDPVETRLMELFDTHLNLDDTPMTRDELTAAVQSSDILVPTVTDNIDAAVIGEAAPDLKLIANFGVGVNHIDLEAAEAKGIQVSNTPDVLTEDTADLAMALILMTPRRLGEGERMIRTGTWTGWAPTQLMGHRVAGKRLGIIGMGRIGRAVAQRARGFGITIHYHNRNRVHEDLETSLEATYWEDLDQMLRHMDIISINTPHTVSTVNILSAARLTLLQQHAIIINTSRGGLVDEEALIEALKSGSIAGAGLDVFDGEPAVNPKFLDLENVVLLPHLGSATIEGRIAMGEKVIVNAKSFVDGHTPPDKVLLTLL
ncbi:MAG: D-glycerate dehydrogenase [Rhodospirillales bacterium]|nr:D-glycerate dehydrogenase [Rhodospirillales bacterium]